MRSTGSARINVQQFIKALVTRPKMQLTALLPKLQKLRSNLTLAMEAKDPLDGIFLFLSDIAKWQDRGLRDVIKAFNGTNQNGRYDKILETLRILQSCFRVAGRNEFGLNRTRPGEAVTLDKIFLGDIQGLPNKPIPYWRNKKNEKKGGWRDPDLENFNAYDVVCQHAQQYMEIHGRQICDLIKSLESEVK